MNALAPSDLAFLDDATLRARVVSFVAAAPDTVFAALADQATWPSWCADCLEARFITPARSTVDAVRVARFRFATFEERILAWEPGLRFAFSVERCSIPIARRAAEDWRLCAKDGGTELSWDLAVDVAPLARGLWPAARLVAEATFRRSGARAQPLLRRPVTRSEAVGGCGRRVVRHARGVLSVVDQRLRDALAGRGLAVKLIDGVTDQNILVDGAVLGRSERRADVRRVLEQAKKRGARIALYVHALIDAWPGCRVRDKRINDPMVTAHYQSFLHLCDVVVGSDDDMRVAGGSDDDEEHDLDEAVRLMLTKTHAAVAVVDGVSWSLVDARGRIGGSAASDALTIVVDSFARGDVRAALVSAGTVIEFPWRAAPTTRASPSPARSSAVPATASQRAAPRWRALPAEGPLLVAGDLHGNLDDLRALANVFERLHAGDARAQWVLLGDVVHGPDPRARLRQPEIYDYDDRTPEVLATLTTLKVRWGDALHLVLGAHEHGHLDGPHPRRFWPDEVEHLDDVAAASVPAIRALFADAPLVLWAPRGVLLCHAAPETPVAPTDLPKAALIHVDARVLTSLLRTTGPIADDVVAPTLAAFSALSPREQIPGDEILLVHGHDEPESGLQHSRRQLCTAIFFGARRADKRYLVLDLAAHYRSADDLVDGREIRRLYP